MSRSHLPHVKAAGAALLVMALLTAALPAGVARAREEDPTTAAQTDQMLRPHFDFLEHRRHRPLDSRGPYGKPPPLQDSVLVDCSRRESLRAALDRVKDNGVLNVRGTCVLSDPLILYFPVKIVGEAQSPFDGVRGGEATLVAAAGQPCIVVQPDITGVTLQDLTIKGDEAGRNSCVILGDRAELQIGRTKIDYIGQKSAIDASTGQLSISDSVINAMNYDPAVVADGTRLSILRTILRTGAVGLVVTPGDGGLVDLDYVSVWSNTSTDDLTNEPETGIVVRGAGTFFKGDQNSQSSGQRPPNFILKHSDVYGYKVGVEVQRGIVGADIETTRIRRAVYGVLSSADNLKFDGGAVSAAHTGVQVNRGNAWIQHNAFVYGGPPSRAIEFAGPTGTADHPHAAEMMVDQNWFYAKSGCREVPEAHPWCGPIPDILMAGNPTDGSVKAGWDGAPFFLPASFTGPPPPPRGEERRGFSLFGLSIGARAGGSVEPDVHH